MSNYVLNFLYRLWSWLPLSKDDKQRVRRVLIRKIPFIQEWIFSQRAWHDVNGPSVKESMQGFDVSLHESPETINKVSLFKGMPLSNKPAKLICFYLPQFHPIPENNTWWGDGFTEWSNVKSAQPQFVGHYQPHVPSDLGYYNLLDPGVQHRQVELAKLYGIEGFCFYFYWFGGKRLLESPTQNYLNDNSLDLPFCLCWANENWTRTWDGLENDILIDQQHSLEDDIAFIQHVSVYLRDSRYIRIDGKPLLLIYRPSLLPSAKKTSGTWRQWCRDEGIGEIYLAYTQSFEVVDPADYGFDAAIEFPPKNSPLLDVTSQVKLIGDDFAGDVYDWNVFIACSRHYKKPNYTLFRSVCPSWDNTARRKNKSSILLNSSPCGYQEWLFNAIGETVKDYDNPEQRLIFINAWNEWAEGTHLEPDERYGFAYLEATRLALVRKTQMLSATKKTKSDQAIAVVIHAFYEDVFDEILGYLNKIHSVSLKLYVTTPIELFRSIQGKLQLFQKDFFIMPVSNRGRDILPFFKIMPQVIAGGHDLLIKVHTKKSIHRQDGRLWRQDIFEKLISERALVTNVDYIAKNPDIGLLGPTGHIVPMGVYFGSNSLRVRQIAARLGIESDALKNLNFVAGTMFMARTQSISPLMNIALTESDFEEEAKQVDGTLAHAIERLFSVSALSVGLKVSCPDNKVIKRYRYTNSC